MSKHISDFLLYDFFLPYSMVIYVGFTSFMMRDLIMSWLKERKEKKTTKNKIGGESPKAEG
jgi:hypothetical protein